MQTFYMWAYYVWKFWIPFSLSPFYDTLLDFQPLSVPFLGSVLLVLGLSAALIHERRRHAGLLLIWICHLVLLVPMLGLTEHPHFPSDRYGFIVGILWSILLAGGGIKLLASRVSSNAATAGVFGAALASLIFLGWLSVRQQSIWHDNISFFDHLTRANPSKTKFLKCLAAVYKEEKKYTEALDCYARLLQIQRTDAGTHQKIAAILFELGRFSEARDHYREIVAIGPNNAGYHNDLGVVLVASGDLTNATQEFELALRLHPSLTNARQNLAKALTQQGRVEEAKAYLGTDISLHGRR